MASSNPLLVKRLDGSSAEISDQALGNLNSLLHGDLLQPGDDGFEQSCSIWNGMIEKKPALSARCIGAADVRACVEFARERGILLSIKGGGHNISGLALSDGGMAIDMSAMKGLWVDLRTNTAHAQAGCTLGCVDRETQLHAKAAVLGFVSETGITGLTLGGGFGYLTRKYGWTSDNVVSFDLITADGRLLRASDEENPDLFWALRGGGGNFGVVTGIQYKLHPIGPEVMAGVIAWPGDEAAKVLAMYGEFMSQAPRELNCAAVLRLAPPAPWLPSALHGKPIIALSFIYGGPVAEGTKLVAPIKSFGSPVGDIVQARSYVSQQCILDATQPRGRRYYWKSEYLPGYSQELFAKFIEHGENITSPHSAMILFPIDGALNELPASHSAVGNRDAKLVLNITASWESAAEDARHVEWARNAWRNMRNLSTGGTYINFLTEDEVGERINDAYGENYRQLAAAKNKWDPDNFFRMNKNIAPLATA